MNIDNDNVLKHLYELLSDIQFRRQFYRDPSKALLKKGLRFLENTPEVKMLKDLDLEELSLIAELNSTDEDVYENIGAGVIF